MKQSTIASWHSHRTASGRHASRIEPAKGAKAVDAKPEAVEGERVPSGGKVVP